MNLSSGGESTFLTLILVIGQAEVLAATEVGFSKVEVILSRKITARDVGRLPGETGR